MQHERTIEKGCSNLKKIGTLLLSVILGIGMIGCSSTDKNENIATVNGNGITLGNYEKVLELNKQSIEMYYGESIWDQEVEEGVKYKDKFKEMVLDQMVYTEAIYEAAKKENLLPTEEEVNNEIKDFKAQLEENEDYIISADGLYIEKMEGTWNESGTSSFNFIVIKGKTSTGSGGSSGGGSSSSGNIEDGSITEEKLSDELKQKINPPKTWNWFKGL